MSLILVGLASAAEYRSIEVADGRTLVGEVVGSDATGMRLRLPQGDTDIAYADIVRVDPVEAAAVHGQSDWRVLVLPTGGADPAAEAAVEAELIAALAQVPHTRVGGLDSLPTTIPEAMRAALGACGLDATCVLGAGSTLPVDVVVLSAWSPGEPEELVAASVWLVAPRAQFRAGGRHAAAERGRAIQAAAWGVLDLVPSPQPPSRDPAPTPEPAAAAEARSPPAPRPPSPWVPLPGWTAWRSGRPGAGLAATAVVVPATAAVVWVAGHESPSPVPALIIGAVTWTSLCVGSNRLLAPVVLPTEGGVSLGLSGRL